MDKVSLRYYDREIANMVEGGHLDEAIAHCKHILEVFPLHIETYRLLGKAFLDSRQYAEAANIFQRILNSVPDDFVSHVGMSVIRDTDGKLDEAIWHLERAFEIQPSNSNIQGELRHLYGRRDGTEPQKIRLSREALANMYLQGELFNQAVAEFRAILAEDPNRPDLQVMLMRAYYRSGHTSEATELAAELLKKYHYCMDALRLLVDVNPSSTQPGLSQVYRRRLYLLDPYSTSVVDSAFNSSKVPDSVVSLERLEYNGKETPVSVQPGVVSDKPEEQATKFVIPEWLLPLPSDEPIQKENPSPAEPEAIFPSPVPPAGQEKSFPDWFPGKGTKAAEAFPTSSELNAQPEEGLLQEGNAVKESTPVPPIPENPAPEEPVSELAGSEPNGPEQSGKEYRTVEQSVSEPSISKEPSAGPLERVESISEPAMKKEPMLTIPSEEQPVSEQVLSEPQASEKVEPGPVIPAQPLSEQTIPEPQPPELPEHSPVIPAQPVSERATLEPRSPEQLEPGEGIAAQPVSEPTIPQEGSVEEPVTLASMTPETPDIQSGVQPAVAEQDMQTWLEGLSGEPQTQLMEPWKSAELEAPVEPVETIPAPVEEDGTHQPEESLPELPKASEEEAAKEAIQAPVVESLAVSAKESAEQLQPMERGKISNPEEPVSSAEPMKEGEGFPDWLLPHSPEPAASAAEAEVPTKDTQEEPPQISSTESAGQPPALVSVPEQEKAFPDWLTAMDGGTAPAPISTEKIVPEPSGVEQPALEKTTAAPVVPEKASQPAGNVDEDIMTWLERLSAGLTRPHETTREVPLEPPPPPLEEQPSPSSRSSDIPVAEETPASPDQVGADKIASPPEGTPDLQAVQRTLEKQVESQKPGEEFPEWFVKPITSGETEQPVSGQPPQGEPLLGQPAEEQITPETPVSEPTLGEQSVLEQPVSDASVIEPPILTHPSPEESQSEQSVLEQPSPEAPVPQATPTSQPALEPAVSEVPMQEPLTLGQPELEKPVEEQPVVERLESEAPTIAPLLFEQSVQEKAVEEKPVTELPVSEEPVIVPPFLGQPVQEKTVEEKPVVEPSALEAPAPVPSFLEQPSTEKAVVEQPVLEQPVMETPVAVPPFLEQPAPEKAVVEQPVVEQNLPEATVAEQPILEQPAPEEAVVEQPVVEQPLPEATAAEQPILEQPAPEGTVVGQTIVGQPVTEVPVTEPPTLEQPAPEGAVVEQPVLEQPVIETSVAVPPFLEQPIPEKTVVEQPVLEQPVMESPVAVPPFLEQPTPEEAVGEQPVVGQPVPEVPLPGNGILEPLAPEAAISEAPQGETAVFEQRVTEPHLEEQPILEQPVQDLPVTQQPVLEQQATETHTVELPAMEQPVAEVKEKEQDEQPEWMRHPISTGGDIPEIPISNEAPPEATPPISSETVQSLERTLPEEKEIPQVLPPEAPTAGTAAMEHPVNAQEEEWLKELDNQAPPADVSTYGDIKHDWLVGLEPLEDTTQAPEKSDIANGELQPPVPLVKPGLTSEPESPAWVDENIPLVEGMSPKTSEEWIRAETEPEAGIGIPSVEGVAPTKESLVQGETQPPVQPVQVEQPAEGPVQPAEPTPAPKIPTPPAVEERDTDILSSARTSLAEGSLTDAMSQYSKLIRKGRLTNEVLHDLQEATQHHPLDINIWQTLGDAYMRVNRLQDALNAYTKAEELLM